MLCVLLFVVFALAAYGEESSDSVSSLKEVEVRSQASSSGVMRPAPGRITVLGSALRGGISNMGENDVVAMVKMLPGYTSGSDYASGVSINGSALSQTSYGIDGTPVFAPFHFGGAFSTFISEHFPSFTIGSGGSTPYSDMRVGGYIDAVSLGYPADKFHSTVSIGTINASATVRVPFGSKTGVTGSIRRSHLDATLGKLLESDAPLTRYSLVDANISGVHILDSCNTFKFNSFFNSDRLGYTDQEIGQHTAMRWGNILGNITWRHRRDDVAVKQTLAYTRSYNRLSLTMPQFDFRMPTSLYRFSVYGDFSKNNLSTSYAINYTTFQPQGSSVDGVIDVVDTTERIHTLDGYFYAGSKFVYGNCALDYGVTFSAMKIFNATSGQARAHAMSQADGVISDRFGKSFFRIDPRVCGSLMSALGEFSAECSIATQYIQQVGFSDIGMASNFWIPPVGDLKPMRATGIAIRYNNANFSDAVGVNAEIFYRDIRHEADYQGNLLDVIAPGYVAMSSVEMADGFNTGANLTIDFNVGKISGWGGYSYALCRRHFPDLPDRWLPSAAEPLHSVKAYTRYAPDRRWEFTAFFTLTSGRPYTPVKSIYIIAGNVLTEYGAVNSARLPTYNRLDLGVTYTCGAFRIGDRNIDSYLNFSVMNVLGRRNVEMQYFRYDTANHTISLHRVYSIYRFMPSLSYTLVI